MATAAELLASIANNRQLPWVPYATANSPLNWPDLPEWDSIAIAGAQFPIEGLPRYAKKLAHDKKSGVGGDNQKITAKGMKPTPVGITLKLWVDIAGGPNYLDLFRAMIPVLLAPRFERRFALPVYHPVLEAYGVTSVVFVNIGPIVHSGNRIFHVELEGENAADIKAGQSTKQIKKPDESSLAGVGGLRGGRFGIVTQTIPRVDGTSVTTAWQGRINMPSSRTGLP